MNYFLSDFEAATSSSTRASTSTGPLVLGMNSGDISMDSGDEREEEEGVVHWQSSQTSSILDSLLRGGTGGKGKSSKSKSSATSDHSNSFDTSANSSFSFDFGADTSGSNATAAFSSNAARNAAPRSRPSALLPSTRRNVSNTTTSSVKPSSSSHATAKPHFDLIADFPKIVKQAMSQVDEDLKQKTSTLSRSNSGSRLCLEGPEKQQRPRKPVSMSNAHAKPRRPSPLHATRSRVMERTVSESTIGTINIGSGREHRVGGDVKGKGRLREASDLSSNSCGPSAIGAGLDRDPKRAKLTEVQDRMLEEMVREAQGRRDMPPPALPPERVTRQQVPVKEQPPFSSTPSTTSTVPPVAKTRPTPAVPPAAKDDRQPVQVPTKAPPSTVSRSAPQHHHPPPRHKPAPFQGIGASAAVPNRPPSQAQPVQHHTRSHSVSNTTTSHGYPPRPVQVPKSVQPPRVPAPPAPSAVPPTSQAGPPRPSQHSHYPPALGMRRVHTFSSSGSQKAYGGFAFASQTPAGASSKASGQGYKSAYEGATGLPTKQKAFRPPLKPRTSSTLALLEKYDFGKGEPVKEVGTGEGASTTVALNGGASTVVDKPVATARGVGAMPPSKAAFIDAFKPKASSRRGGSAGSGTPGPESLSASTSTSSSDTLSSRGETPPPTAAFMSAVAAARSPVTPVTTATTTTAAPANESRDDDELLSDDPNDSSFGEVEWDLDIDAAAETGMILFE